jgi:mono/diheme cytochrome c family protein
MDYEDMLNESKVNANQIKVFLDDQKKPIVTYQPPVRFELDTTQLSDGKHKLRIEAADAIGTIGTRTVHFEVRNGPGIGIDGIKNGDILDGKVAVLANAYGGASEPYWEPARAETPSPIPSWAWVLLLVIVGWSLYYVAIRWKPPAKFASTPTYSLYTKGGIPAAQAKETSTGPEGKLGGTLYRTSCSSCHQANGEGVSGVFPPLSADPVVTAKDPTQHIHTVLFGLQGKEINGTTYNAAMPAFSKQLSDDEVAAIINHERTSWGNNAPTVTADDVAKVRASGGSK